MKLPRKAPILTAAFFTAAALSAGCTSATPAKHSTSKTTHSSGTISDFPTALQAGIPSLGAKK